MLKKTSFPFALFFAILILNLVPTIYETTRTLFLTKNDVEGFSIAGHMEWFDLVHEIILTMCVFPLYFLFKKYIDEKETFKNVFKSVLVIFSIIYALVLSFVFLNIDGILSLMNVTENTNQVKVYLGLETFSLFFQFLYQIIFVLFVIMGYTKIFYILIVIKTVGLVLTDFFFIQEFGVNGIAYSNIVFSVVLVFVSFFLLEKKEKFNFFNFKFDFSWLKDWTRVGGFAGGQIFLDNFMYALVVMQMINLLSTQGNYWIANNFIWGILLVPVIALNEIIKKEATINKNLSFYFFIAFCIAFVWVLSIPIWKTFFHFSYGFDSKMANEIFSIVILLLPFYFTYLFSTIIDNYFYGLGETKYPFINSLIVNCVYYPIAYLLIKMDVLEVTMTFIILLFGFGMVVHLIISTFQYTFFKRKYKKESF